MKDYYSVINSTHLAMNSVDLVTLSAKYGTPLYVMNKDKILQNITSFKSSIERYFSGKGKVLYASKAFSCFEMYRIAKSENIGIDVVSSGELYTALCASFPPNDIYFHGNNKTASDILFALENNVGKFVVDNIQELHLLDAMAKAQNKVAKILLRIKPGIDAHTHDFVKTGQIDSKFGFALENGEACEAYLLAANLSNIKLVGLHCHIGSQIFDTEPFELAALVLLTFAGEMFSKCGLFISELNLGGGYGIKYTENDDPPPFDTYMKNVSKVVRGFCEKNNQEIPFICIEPGRSIVADAGVTLYTVGSVKHIKNVRTYVSVDGGMADNPRYALYKSRYEMVVANRANEPKTMVATVAGRCCESGDILGEEVVLAEVTPGDILAVLDTGAYNFSMSSNYNRLTKPPVVLIEKGEDRLIVKGETLKDIVRNDI